MNPLPHRPGARPAGWAPAQCIASPAGAWIIALVIALLSGPAAVGTAGQGGAAGADGAAVASSREAGAAPAPLVRIPAGEAWLGSDDREKGYGYAMGGAAAWQGQWFRSERRRRVRLPGYDLEETPVTQGAYARFVAATGQRAPHIGAAEYRAQGFLVHGYEEVRPYLWQQGRPPAGRGEHPAVLVSHADAAAYCAWRGRVAGRACRLPTEDEWELAARGTDGRYYPWGNAWEPERVNTQERGPYGTTPVRAHPRGRSPYGLYDMAGNVFEWTASSDTPGKAILKGGSWDDLGGICRAAARHERPVESRHILIGFRCLCELP
jgi:formylglycine-generating enzyme required for sulfatase activity